ncbi:histidine--tRNA ligase [candidate division KSB1 bacterium]
MAKVQPRLFRGMRDFLPAEMNARDHMLAIIKGVFRTYGYQPLETPAVEYMDILAGKYGDEGEKLIYPLAYKGGKTLALRYDLTVPLARLVAANPDIPRPFRRYQIQPVWRADRAQIGRGRFREFYQCDVDCVGSASVLVELEIATMTADVFKGLGFPDFRIRINHRAISQAVVQKTGETRVADALRALDKLDKIGLPGVQDEMEKYGIPQGKACDILTLLQLGMDLPGPERLRMLTEQIGGSPEVDSAARDIHEVLVNLDRFEIDQVAFDPFLARGLDYYTGMVFETDLPTSPEFGSLAAGGRYDDLVAVFSETPEPACGVSFGLDRIHTAMDKLDLIPDANRSASADLLVALFDSDSAGRSLEVAQQLRRVGIPVELYPEAVRLKKQFAFAHKRGIPMVIVPGPDEWDDGRKVTLKNMGTGEQQTLTLDQLIKHVRPES